MSNEKTIQRKRRSELSKFQMTVLFNKLLEYTRNKLEESLEDIPFSIELSKPGLFWDGEILQLMSVKVKPEWTDVPFELFRITLQKYHRAGNSMILYHSNSRYADFTWRWGVDASAYYPKLCKIIDTEIKRFLYMESQEDYEDDWEDYEENDENE